MSVGCGFVDFDKYGRNIIIYVNNKPFGRIFGGSNAVYIGRCSRCYYFSDFSKMMVSKGEVRLYSGDRYVEGVLPCCTRKRSILYNDLWESGCGYRERELIEEWFEI